MRPGAQPFYALAGALLPLLEDALSETDRLAETRKLAERMAKQEVGLAQVVDRIHEKWPQTRRILVVIDQFEELYTLCPDAKSQQAFIDELRLAYSPDGRHLAAAAMDGKVRIWDPSSGELLTELSTNPPHPWKGGLAYSPDGAYLAAGGFDGFWTLWDLASGRALATVAAHTNWLQGLAFSPDGLYLATSSFDGTAKIWDISTILEAGESPREVLTYTGHMKQGASSNWAFDVAFSPDGQLVASVGSEAMVRVWDASSGQDRLSLPGGEGAINTTSVAISPDGMLIAGAQLNGVIRVWEATTGRLVHELTGHSAGIFDLDFGANGTLLGSASFDLTWTPLSRG